MNTRKNNGLLGIVLGSAISLMPNSVLGSRNVKEVILDDSPSYSSDALSIETTDGNKYLVLDNEGIRVKSNSHPEFNGKYSANQLRVNIYERDPPNKRDNSEPTEQHGLKFIYDNSTKNYKIQLPEWAANGSFTADLENKPEVIPDGGYTTPKNKVGIILETTGYPASEGIINMGEGRTSEPEPKPEPKPEPRVEKSGFDAALSLDGSKLMINPRFEGSKLRYQGLGFVGTGALGYFDNTYDKAYKLGGFFSRGADWVKIKDLITNDKNYGRGVIRDQLRAGLVAGFSLDGGLLGTVDFDFDVGYLNESLGLEQGSLKLGEKHKGVVVDGTLGLTKIFVDDPNFNSGFSSDLSVEVVDVTQDNGSFKPKYGRKTRLANTTKINFTGRSEGTEFSINPGLRIDDDYSLAWKDQLPQSAIDRISREQGSGKPNIDLTEFSKGNVLGLQGGLEFMVEPKNSPVYIVGRGLYPVSGALERSGVSLGIGGKHWALEGGYLRTEVLGRAVGGQGVYEESVNVGFRTAINPERLLYGTKSLLPRTRDTQPNLR